VNASTLQTPYSSLATRRGAPRIVSVVRGQFHVSDEKDVVITTILGSCISACMRDPELGLGGINHFMLPDGAGANPLSYGAHAMEMLINALMRAGGDRRRFEVKLAGGADVTGTATDIGARNIEFAKSFLRREGFRVRDEDLGGRVARNLRYVPSTGEMTIRKVDTASTAQISRSELKERVVSRKPEPAGDIELF